MKTAKKIVVLLLLTALFFVLPILQLDIQLDQYTEQAWVEFPFSFLPDEPALSEGNYAAPVKDRIGLSNVEILQRPPQIDEIAWKGYVVEGSLGNMTEWQSIYNNLTIKENQAKLDAWEKGGYDLAIAMPGSKILWSKLAAESNQTCTFLMPSLVYGATLGHLHEAVEAKELSKRYATLIAFKNLDDCRLFSQRMVAYYKTNYWEMCKSNWILGQMVSYVLRLDEVKLEPECKNPYLQREG